MSGISEKANVKPDLLLGRKGNIVFKCNMLNYKCTLLNNDD